MNSFLITATLLIQEVTLGYELYKMTHDPLMLGLVGLAEAIPFIALSLFGGHLADRRDKKRILQWSLLVILLGSVILYLVFQPSVVVGLVANGAAGYYLWGTHADWNGQRVLFTGQFVAETISGTPRTIHQLGYLE